MIRRPARCLGTDPAEPEFARIEFVDENVDHPNGIVLIDPVIEAFRQKRTLPSIHSFNEALHPIPRKSPENHNIEGVFTQPGSFTPV